MGQPPGACTDLGAGPASPMGPRSVQVLNKRCRVVDIWLSLARGPDFSTKVQTNGFPFESLRVGIRDQRIVGATSNGPRTSGERATMAHLTASDRLAASIQ